MSIERDSPVRGRVGSGAAVLRKRIGYRNSFQTVLAVTWGHEGAGTLLQCHGRLNIFAIIFLSIWFGVAGFVGLVFLVVSPDAVQGNRIDALMTIVLVLGLGVAVVAFSRVLARNEEKYLLSFVRYVLDAKDVA